LNDMGRARANDIRAETTISRTGDWLSADTGDGAVMMSPSAAQYIGLSSTGGRIWELLARPRTFGDLCAALADEYEITAADAEPDVRQFIASLAERGALALA